LRRFLILAERAQLSSRLINALGSGAKEQEDADVECCNELGKEKCQYAWWKDVDWLLASAGSNVDKKPETLLEPEPLALPWPVLELIADVMF